MEWWMMFMMGLASPAVPAAATLSPGGDGLTLDPLVSVQTQPREPAEPLTAEAPAVPEDIFSLNQSLVLEVDTSQLERADSDDRAGFIYEPVYSSTSDRIQYQLGSGLGVGMTTDAAWTISQSVRLRRGLDLSVYYTQPSGLIRFDDVLEPGAEPESVPEAPSAGIRLEWKF